MWWFPLGALPLVLVAMVAGLALTGAAGPPELFDPGPIVRWGLPVVTALTWASATVTIGAFALCALVLPRPAAGRGDSRDSGDAWHLLAPVGAMAAVVWALAQLAHLLLTHAAVLGTPIGGDGYDVQLIHFVTEIEMGRYLALATLLVAVIPLLAVATTSYASVAGAGVLALLSLYPVAQTGHAAGAANHDLAVSSWWLHLGGVTVWVGGLVALCLVASRLGRDLPRVVERYSRVALWAFVITTVAGAANAWIRLTTPLDLLTHPYGQLLLLKVVLTLVLGMAGWVHRTWTMPTIRAHTGTGGATAGWAFWRLAGVEVLVMGAVVGIGVALGSSPTPQPLEPVSNAGALFVLTGYPEPPAPTVLTYLTQWRPEPMTAFAALAGVVVYVRWARRLRLRGDAWSTTRTLSWVVGLALFFWVTNGGPAAYGSVLFSGHMIQHMLLAMVVPIFLVLAAPVTLALRALPARRDGSRGPREWLLAFVHSSLARFFSHPVVAGVNFAGSLIVFYYSPLFEYALTSHIGHLLMVVHFTAAGYLFANALIGVDPGPARPSYPLRLLLLFATMAFHAFFGISLISQTTVLAADFFSQLNVSWGGDLLADQEVGGAITWGIGEIPTLALAVAVALAWAKEDDRTARRSDRKAERDDDAELRAYNDMLADLSGHPAGETEHEKPPERREPRT
ncbi:cytochrome c oxidase assembly protein [Georgenia subflava]|uniref:cytochrome c oxidase assembly protein n=1 Tax=Georgenia subflava TaxID=1622177 RepID=UPI001D013CB3|nr:cytochrome c oxidase assembly protein [Georgenia subflava]